MFQVELRLRNGELSGIVIPVTTRKLVIGREPDCQLRLNNDRVSRHHCVIVIDEFTVRIRDLESCNGTFVNDVRLAGTTTLKSGDLIQVADLTIEVVFKLATLPTRGDVPRDTGPAVNTVAVNTPAVDPPAAESATKLGERDTLVESSNRAHVAEQNRANKNQSDGGSPVDIIRAKLAARLKPSHP